MTARRESSAARAHSGRKAKTAGADVVEQMRSVLANLEEKTLLWQQFLHAHRTIVEQLAEQMKNDHNLPLEWFDVLIHLADVPEGRLRQRTLCDRLLLSESGVSRLLLRMERAGLIARSIAGEDKRGMEITLTSKGRAAVMEATESHADLVATLFTERLTQTDINALGRVLPKLAAGGEHSGAPVGRG